MATQNGKIHIFLVYTFIYQVVTIHDASIIQSIWCRNLMFNYLIP